MFRRIFLAHSPKTFELFHFPMFEFWSNLTRPLLTNSNQISDRKAEYIDEGTIRILESGSLRTNFGFRSLEAAVMVLKIARLQDSSLRRSAAVDAYFELLTAVEDAKLGVKSFNGMSVVTLEGLAGSGKSSLAASIEKGCVGMVQVLSARNHPIISSAEEVFNQLPAPVIKAFEFVNLYILAYEITQKNATNDGSLRKAAYIIEDYYHHICTKNISEQTCSETAVQELDSSFFEWPYDLPQPDLVLFLSVTTHIRLKRLRLCNASHHQDHVEEKSESFFGGRLHRRSSSSMANARSGTRTIARDAKTSLAYSMVVGPGTVGIDASEDALSVLSTSIEALDYYGVYNISRNISYPLQVFDINASEVIPESTPMNDSMKIKEEDNLVITKKPFTFDENDENMTSSFANRSPPASVEKNNKSKRRESKFSAITSQDWLAPQEANDVILDRRISMGVYGMFTNM